MTRKRKPGFRSEHAYLDDFTRTKRRQRDDKKQHPLDMVRCSACHRLYPDTLKRCDYCSPKPPPFDLIRCDGCRRLYPDTLARCDYCYPKTE